MALKFRKVERKIRFGENAGQVKTYAIAKSSGHCDLAKLCEMVSARCAMSSADIKAVIDSVNWVMNLELRSGNIIQFGEFGNFRLSISSEGTDTKKEFTASHIKKARIVFTPGASLRETKTNVTFTYDEPQTETEECERPHAD